MTVAFTPFTHDDLVAGIHAIAGDAAAWAPTLLVGIGRGGLAPGVYLSHRMGVPLVSIDHSSRIAPFGSALVAELARRSREGERLLFVEDINDSGRTLGELRAALSADNADIDQIRFAVLLDNIRSAQPVDYRFRTIDRTVQKDWFVFPWEALAPRDTVEADSREMPERLA